MQQYELNQNEEPRPELLRLLLTYALDMVDAMNKAEGFSHTSLQVQRVGQFGKDFGNFGDDKKLSVLRKDLMAPFKASKKYSFYWKLRKEMEIQKRFSGKT